MELADLDESIIIMKDRTRPPSTIHKRIIFDFALHTTENDPVQKAYIKINGAEE